MAQVLRIHHRGYDASDGHCGHTDDDRKEFLGVEDIECGVGERAGIGGLVAED